VHRDRRGGAGVDPVDLAGHPQRPGLPCDGVTVRRLVEVVDALQAGDLRRGDVRDGQVGVQGLLERDRLVTRVRDLERDGEPGTDDDGADDREPVRPGRAARGGRVDEPQPDRDVVTVVLRAVDGPRRRPCEPVEVVPGLVEVEVAVPRLTAALR